MTADPDSPKKNRSWLWTVLGMAGVVVLFLGIAAPFYLQDESPPEDGDLRVRDPVVPAEQNGLVQMRNLPGGLVDFVQFAGKEGVKEEEAQDIFAGVKTNDELVDKFLVQAQPAFEKLDEVLQLPHFAFNDDISPTTLLPEISIMIKYARILRISASRHQALGDYPSAVHDVELMRLLARRLSEGYKPLVQVLTACSVNGMARKTAQDLFDDPALPAASTSALTQEFGREISWPRSMQRSINVESLLLVNALDMVKQGRTTPMALAGSKSPAVPFINLSFRENETKQAAIDFYRDLRQSLGRPYSASKTTAFTGVQSYVGNTSSVQYWLRPNLAGRSILGILTPSFDRLADMMYTQTAADRLLLIEGAVRQYFDAHHALPATLNDLVPDFLPAIPHDPFNDKPLLYDATRGVIYSVGTSLKDMGGSSYLKTTLSTPRDGDSLTDQTQPSLQLRFQSAPPTKPAN